MWGLFLPFRGGFYGKFGYPWSKSPGKSKGRSAPRQASARRGRAKGEAKLKLSESLYPAEKQSKKEPSATAFSGCGGDGSSNESLKEEDAIQVELQGSELWKRFHDIGTEMIITKAGRFGSAQVIQGSPTVGV